MLFTMLGVLIQENPWSSHGNLFGKGLQTTGFKPYHFSKQILKSFTVLWRNKLRDDYLSIHNPTGQNKKSSVYSD